MYEAYEKLFEWNLKMCQRRYDPSHPYDNLKNCIKQCERSYWKLVGMIDFMKESGLLSDSRAEEEYERIVNTFSTTRMFRAYEEDGAIKVFA